MNKGGKVGEEREEERDEERSSSTTGLVGTGTARLTVRAPSLNQ